MKKYSILLFGLLLSRGSPLAAQWRIEAWFGDAWNAHSELNIYQNGEPDLHIMAHWSTRPWRPTWYYSGRISKWNGDHAWAFEYMHHKIYLDNPTAEVNPFRITNGVNNFLGERLWRKRGWELGVGLGPVLAVPISTVRGKTSGIANGIFDSDYQFAGGTLQGSVARRLKLLPYTYGEVAIKGTITGLHVGINDGHATLMNYAIHLQYGLSLQSKP